MDLPFELAEFVAGLPPTFVISCVLVAAAIYYWRRAGILLARLESENRRLRRGLVGYEQMERDHLELSQESRERNHFQRELPQLISHLNHERTLGGVASRLLDFASGALGASETSLFLVEGGTLVMRDARGIPNRPFALSIGEAGRLGAVARFRRAMAAGDFRGLDPASRAALMRAPVRIDTVVAAPLLARGELLGILNVGGSVTASPAVRKEILSVVAQLGATALENQLNFERLEREATTDGLTGLSNVRNFRDKFRQELARASRYGRSLSVFLFDLDHFKHYNDRNGHPAGDECLRMTAEILRRNSRVTDLAARYGGEEFIVLLPETNAAGGLVFAEKIRAIVAGARYPAGEKQPLGAVTISGGVATFPDDGADADGLIAAADQALYRSKDGGRNRVLSAGQIAPAGSLATEPG